MVSLDERRTGGQENSISGLPSSRAAAARPWDYSLIYKEKDSCVRCLINSNVLFKCHLFKYVAEAGSISCSSERLRRIRELAAFPPASPASLPSQQAPQEDVRSCCWVALGSAFRVTSHLEPQKDNPNWQAPCSLGRHSALCSHKDIKKWYL